MIGQCFWKRIAEGTSDIKLRKDFRVVNELLICNDECRGFKQTCSDSGRYIPDLKSEKGKDRFLRKYPDYNGLKDQDDRE